jgi:hypothetical protein
VQIRDLRVTSSTERAGILRLLSVESSPARRGSQVRAPMLWKPPLMMSVLTYGTSSSKY